MYILTILL